MRLLKPRQRENCDPLAVRADPNLLPDLNRGCATAEHVVVRIANEFLDRQCVRIDFRDVRRLRRGRTALTRGETRITDWLPHPPMYNVLPSFDISRPFGPAASVPGTFFHPVPVCHSHTSPLLSPAIILPRAAGSAGPRAWKFVVMKPPSGRPTTAFNHIGSGATAHPTHVNVGGLARASSSKTSIDSLLPWWTTYNVCTEFFPE